MDMLPNSELSLPRGQFISYGKERETEIQRYQDPDKSLSGVIFKTDGGLFTASHVVEAHNLKGFSFHNYLDLAYKRDFLSKGLRLGYINRPVIYDAEVVTSGIEHTDNLTVVSGSISLSPGSLELFRPKSLVHTSLFVPGSSGSPIIYKNHIIGLISVSNVHLEHNREIQIGAVVFGPSVKESLDQQFGLQLDKVE